MIKRGFSLLELMITLVILSGVIAVAWPNLTRKLKSVDQINFDQKLKETVEDCRYNAIVKGQVYAVVVQEKKINVLTLDNIDFDGIIEEQVIWINANGEVYEK